MRFSIVCLLVGCLAAVAVGQQGANKIPRLTTLAGRTYTNVTVGESDVNGLHIKHSTGAATIPWPEVPEELRASVGYSPQKVGAAEKEPRRTALAPEPKARIGATPDDFRRAGWTYVGQNAGPLGSTEMQFQRGNYTVTATFWGGYCHELMIMDSVMVDVPGSADLIMAGKELTGAYEDFIRTVLDSNAGEAQWREQRLLTRYAREWVRT